VRNRSDIRWIEAGHACRARQIRQRFPRQAACIAIGDQTGIGLGDGRRKAEPLV
jgi:hypothetical protein